MDDADPKYGRFKRAQRAVQVYLEQFISFCIDFFLAGYVFPWTTALCASSYGVFRLKGTLDYAGDRKGGRLKGGNMFAAVAASGLGGMMFTTGFYATYLEVKKLKA